MVGVKLLLLYVVLLLVSVQLAFGVSLSACGIISSAGPYLVSQNIGTGGYCLNITASHVLLDCQGYNITYGGHSPGNGVNSQGAIGNITIKNCRFFQNLSLETLTYNNQGASIALNVSANNTIYNNTFYTRTDGATLWLDQVNNTNISWNSFTHICGVFALNATAIQINTDTLNSAVKLYIDNNVINVTCVGANGIFIGHAASESKNVSIRNNVMNSSRTTLTFHGSASGSIISGNRIYSYGGAGLDVRGADTIIQENQISVSQISGSASYAFQSFKATNFLVRSNTIKSFSTNSAALILQALFPDYVNDSLFDNNTIMSSYLPSSDPARSAVYLYGNVYNNVFVNNNISALEGVQEIYDENSTLANYLIYNNSNGEIAWMNNGTGGFLGNLTIFVNGSLNLGETIIINTNLAAVNTSAFTPKQMINSSANITLRGLSGDTLSSITKDPEFRTTAASVSGSDCLTSSPVTCYQKSFSGGVLIFNTTSFSSFTSVTTSSSGSSSVPEFQDYAMMFILVIGISGFFVMKKREEASG